MIIALVILLSIGSIIFSNILFVTSVDEQCEKFDMEVLSYSAGGFFTSSELNCWDPKTKEIKKIK